MAIGMQQYIISFQATLQGHKMVLTALKGMERQVKGVTATTKTAGQATATYGQQMGKLASRALMVIPVWLVLRAAMMTVMRTFGDMVRAFIDLDDQLARIRTVMHGSAEVINMEMVAIKRQILDTSLKSRLAIKDLAEGFYFLKTANLDATEAMAAFEPTVNLAIGTMNSMGESARAVAGIYNTMGQYLDENLTIHEKFQHIADVLAYTYSTQDVQLNELIQSYTKLAPYITGLSDSFLELTTMLGFLNTRLLRSGRTGRLTGRAILQLTKNAKKLRGIFDIAFDPDKPIAFLETIGKIRDAMQVTGKLTAEQGDIVQKVFATRAGVVIRLLIEHWDDLSEQIKDAIENVDGFAKKMQEIRMETIAGQMARMKNVLAILMDEFLSTATGAKNLAESIRFLNNALESFRPVARAIGSVIAYLGAGFRENYYWVRAFTEAMEEMPTRGIPLIGGIPIAQLQRAGELVRQYREEDIKGIQESQKARLGYLESEEKIKALTLEQTELYKKWNEAIKEERQEDAKAIDKIIKAKQKLIDDLQPAEVKLAKLKNDYSKYGNQLEEEALGFQNKQIERDKHRIRLMKILGASTLDIARVELEMFAKRVEGFETLEEEQKLLSLRLKVSEEEIKYRQQITDVFLRAEIDLLKAAGISETKILEIREKQIRVQAVSKGVEWERLQLLNLRIQQQGVLLREKAKEADVARSLAISYEKADMFQKAKVRRAIELIQLTDEELAARYRSDVYDREVMLEYWGSFRKSAQEAITETIWSMRRFPGEIPKLEDKDLLPKDEIIKYWQNWTERGINAGNVVNANFKAGMPTFGIPGGGVPPVGAPVGAGIGGLPTPIPTELPPKLPEPIYTSYGVRELSGKLNGLIAVTKEGNLILTDNLERTARERDLLIEELKTIEEAIKDGTLDQITVQQRISDSLKSF